MPNINVKDISFSFASRCISIPNFSSSFDEILLIKGSIGSGKTLLLKTLAGLTNPDSGSVSLTNQGKDLSSIYVHSQPEFNFVTGSVSEELSFSGISEKGFEKYLNKDVEELSGGELKKIALMMALRSSKDIIILDEPLDMMDDKLSASLSEYILSKSKKVPIIIATHDSQFDKYGPTMDFNIKNTSTNWKFIHNNKPGKEVFRCSNVSIEASGKRTNNVSFSLHEKEIICILGNNGSGKTLFLKTLGGIGKFPYKGSYSWVSPPGVCLQFPEHMIYQNTVEKEIAEIVGTGNTEKVLNSLGWKDRKDSSPFFLSDGEKRIMYLTSMINNRQCCLFDEPFASVDEETRINIAKMFVSARDAGKSLIYTANRENDTIFADKILRI